MDIDKAIEMVAANYANRGYAVIARPRPDQLPAFARDFNVQLLGQMRDVGVLVAIKRNRTEFAADPEMDRYAEIVSGQPGWRFDFVLLEGEGDRGETRGAQELSDEELNGSLAVVDTLIGNGFMAQAFVSAWAVAEAAMRRRLRAEGQIAGWGTTPRQMMNELVSNGFITMEEFALLENASRTRNEIVHGFATREVPRELTAFLVEFARRFMSETSSAKQTADA